MATSENMSVEGNDTDIYEDDAMVALELSIRAQKRAVVKTKETVKENLLLKRALAVAHAKNSKLMLHILEYEKLARRDISHLAADDRSSVGVVTPSQQNRPTAGSSNRSPTPVGE
ncbi:hypothetical protein HDE_05983 [Halotydeus destructor]|nr:hypothetical protein HDE_05983 [Halotydeus destructor]